MYNRKIQPVDDSKIWLNFKQGNIEAFNLIFKKYYHLMYNYGYQIYPDKEFIKDNLQDLFFEIWKDREKLGDVRSVKFYLLISFRRKVISVLTRNRKQFQQQKQQTQLEEQVTFSYEQQMIDGQLENEQMQHLQQELTKLPPRQKEAIYLKYFQELPYDEITQIMSLKYQTVRDLIYKGIKTLRSNTRQVNTI
ncbi:MAG: RNA polymerase sigma factor [Candidatus Cyclobacteriaceae bacterium M3_2C_046]